MDEPRYTGDDLDALEQLKISQGYRLFVAKVKKELVRRVRELETDLDYEDTLKCRGKVAALRTVLQMEEILREEIRAAIQEQEVTSGR